MTVTEIRQILESPYDRKVWKSFLQTQFTNNKLNAEDRTISLSDKTLSKQCLSLGNYEVNEYTKIGIFEVELNEKVNIARNRVALRNLIKDITQQVAGAVVVFVQGDKWRFSYISKRKVKGKETNSILVKETAPKRYTYLFGNGEKALTAAIRFEKLIQKQKENVFQLLSLDDFEEAFSVDKLSKEFFSKYKEIYEDFVEFITGVRYVKKSGKWVESKTHDAHFQLRNYFDNDEKQARDFVKRMMGRIVFLYFIQKKGWLAVPREKKWGEGDFDYLFELFNKAKYKESFYSDYLVPLFFDTLNNVDVQKASNELRFPYLNGGLFDKSQDYKYDKIALPSEIFDKLFSTFNNFNFTIYEDAPDEHTVAVDPEMLGHIFENLLEDNKDKGAFYTPKDVVHYMCRESLHNYIYTYTGNKENEDFKARLCLYNDTYDVKLFDSDELKKIDRALEDVKICDPAIGSGAFPMGLLHEIYHLKIPIEDNKGFKAKTPADLKKHIIEESIYGVDIDSGAVDIARLRFWLSLVVDETEPQPLPNLAFKIVCANTLIPLGMDNTIQIAGATDIIREIEKLRHNYFDASKDEKKDLERQFKNLQNKLWNTAKDWVTSKDAEIYERLLEFNPFEDKSCGWFDQWWMFGVKDGFDIVIGNPPYVQLQKNNGTLSKKYEKVGYKTFERTGDIYSLFYERGWKMLKPHGTLCFITSNKWMRAGYGESTRKFFTENTNPLLLIDFAGQKIFEAATVDVNILMFTKEKNQQKTLATIVKENVLNELSVFVRQSNNICSFNDSGSWTILSDIEQQIKQKIERIGTPLKDWDIQINYGIKTGFNEAFIITGEKRKELIEQDHKSAEIIRPILRGRDIKRYGYEFADLYLISTFPSLKIDIENYPAVKKHLLSFGMKRLEQTGNEYYVDGETVKARKKTCNKWFETQDSISYWDDFSKQKIVWKRVGSILRFSYDETGKMALDSTCFATGKHIKFLVAVLNSKMGHYLMKDAPQTGTGDLLISVQAIEPLKIPIPNESTEQVIEKAIDAILKKQSPILEKELNQIIFSMYKLDKKEISFIENL
jgi:adenine-specific DNA-methyltransferase